MNTSGADVEAPIVVAAGSFQASSALVRLLRARDVPLIEERHPDGLLLALARWPDATLIVGESLGGIGLEGLLECLDRFEAARDYLVLVVADPPLATSATRSLEVIGLSPRGENLLDQLLRLSGLDPLEATVASGPGETLDPEAITDDRPLEAVVGATAQSGGSIPVTEEADLPPPDPAEVFDLAQRPAAGLVLEATRQETALTGTLEFEAHEIRRRLHFEAGRLVDAESTATAEQLAHTIGLSGTMSPGDLEALRRRAAAAGRSLEEALVASGMLTAEQLEQLRERHRESLAITCCAMTTGRATRRTRAGAAGAATGQTPEPRAAFWVTAGIRRIIEGPYFERFFPGPTVGLVDKRRNVELFRRDLPLSRWEWRALEKLRLPCTLAEARAGLTELTRSDTGAGITIDRFLFLMSVLGVIAFDEGDEGAREESRAQGDLPVTSMLEDIVESGRTGTLTIAARMGEGQFFFRRGALLSDRSPDHDDRIKKALKRRGIVLAPAPGLTVWEALTRRIGTDQDALDLMLALQRDATLATLEAYLSASGSRGRWTPELPRGIPDLSIEPRILEAILLRHLPAERIRERALDACVAVRRRTPFSSPGIGLELRAEESRLLELLREPRTVEDLVAEALPFDASPQRSLLVLQALDLIETTNEAPAPPAAAPGVPPPQHLLATSILDMPRVPLTTRQVRELQRQHRLIARDDPFEILGVSARATLDEVDAAYRTKMTYFEQFENRLLDGVLEVQLDEVRLSIKVAYRRLRITEGRETLRQRAAEREREQARREVLPVEPRPVVGSGRAEPAAPTELVPTTPESSSAPVEPVADANTEATWDQQVPSWGEASGAGAGFTEDDAEPSWDEPVPTWGGPLESPRPAAPVADPPPADAPASTESPPPQVEGMPPGVVPGEMTGQLHAMKKLREAKNLIKKRRYAKAVEPLEEVLRCDDENPATWYYLALCLFRSGRRDAAMLRALNRALADEPENPLFLRLRAEVLIERGDRAEAKVVLKKILARNPGDEAARKLLGSLRWWSWS